MRCGPPPPFSSGDFAPPVMLKLEDEASGHKRGSRRWCYGYSWRDRSTFALRATVDNLRVHS